MKKEKTGEESWQVVIREGIKGNSVVILSRLR